MTASGKRAAAWRVFRKLYRDLLIDLCGNQAGRSLAAGTTRLATGWLRIRLGPAFGEWRSLPFERTQRFLELLFQRLDLGKRSVQTALKGAILPLQRFHFPIEIRILLWLSPVPGPIHPPYRTRNGKICSGGRSKNQDSRRWQGGKQLRISYPLKVSRSSRASSMRHIAPHPKGRRPALSPIDLIVRPHIE